MSHPSASIKNLILQNGLILIYGGVYGVPTSMTGISPRDKIRVVIFGVHSPDWMSALHSKAAFWKNIPGVEEVLSVTHEVQDIPLAQHSAAKTVLIPLMEAHAQRCPSGFFGLIPSAESLVQLGVKSLFTDYMEREGLAHFCPIHYKNLDAVRYPCVLKRVNLCAGIGVALIRSKSELNSRVQEPLWHEQPLVLQEALLEGTEFVTHLVLKNGRILWHASFCYALGDNEYIRTPSNVVKISRVGTQAHALKAFESCLKPLNFSGPCNIDYKISDKGVLKILEINPRLGGSLMRADTVDLLTDALSCIIHNAEFR